MQEEANNFASFAKEGTSAQSLSHRASDPLVMPSLVDRLDSSPNARDMGFEGLGLPLSPAEKRRNKLGYHRTAVACGHCRRRKIRCLPAFDDPVGRCQNCIRLKKDCHFYPVEQPNIGPARRLGSDTKSTEGASNEADTSVASSSPGGILRSASFERFEQVDGRLDKSPLSRDSPGYPGFHPGPRSMSGPGFDYPNPYDYRQQPQQQHPQQPQQVLNRHSPGGYVTDSRNAQFYPAYGHSSHGPYPPVFITGAVSGSGNMTAFSRDSGYDYRVSSPNGVYNWGQSPARSVSMGETGDSPHSFRPTYRMQNYPSIERRVTGDIQHLPPTSTGFMPMSVETQTGTDPTFPEPTAYPPIPWPGHEQRAQLSGSSGAPTPVWYPQQSGLMDVRDGERQPHILPSQDRESC
ncbi:hypothetical protein A1O3_03477 [Capronia epimyces CBS 606.96]|uniref:Zn(2)-C6 fungal-type domain-containing protein n=1 Tax=Capronia epimyces CBS 606.96 TaxID=1182542 RepID=W9YBA1_9EURO|nr:uncharacterized protein A1O3_03477 [Capronia epimyces CBS 606.96]EXJ86526.1 hypothetical protein A1O3_03477 [Capronia epimyces CBS 606.96]